MKRIFVYVKGNKENNPLSLMAEKVEDDTTNGKLKLYDKDGNVIASFNTGEIVGWNLINA